MRGLRQKRLKVIGDSAAGPRELSGKGR